MGALTNVFADILQNVSLRNIYLLIDTLDECDTGLSKLLHFVPCCLSASFRVKWMASGRNCTSIEGSSTWQAVSQGRVLSSLKMHNGSLCITNEQSKDALFKHMHLRRCVVQQLVWLDSCFSTKSQKESKAGPLRASAAVRPCRYSRVIAIMSYQSLPRMTLPSWRRH